MALGPKFCIMALDPYRVKFSAGIVQLVNHTSLSQQTVGGIGPHGTLIGMLMNL